ncbi:GAF domain-containing protein [Roseiconus lacunae]|uniref:GAF domain-containing protein n=1 Tax=Roseiconus lacunae TaxID=2605694 RepID=UPI00308ABCB8|nr:GAF domain-containing protein [Stieleria sp. HD01]
MSTTSTESPTSFLIDIVVIDHVDGDLHLLPKPGAFEQSTAFEHAICETRETGLPAIISSTEEDDHVVLSVPIYCNGEIKTIVCFIGSGRDQDCGVMEVWQPIGVFDELSMTKGYFGALERFQNVSSFVRFEKGSGLPGQVWRNASFVIHDHLPSHSGFLRAAGASAEALEVAVGIPVIGDEFLASVLLISSSAAPLAKGFEVWRVAGDKVFLESSAYQAIDDSRRLHPETKLPMSETLAGRVIESGTALVTDDASLICRGRNASDPGCDKAFAMPFFEGDRVTNVLVMLL